MVVLDAVARRLPGAIREESGAVESFSQALEGGLEFPHYTRPAEFRGWRVPEVLLSGNHGLSRRGAGNEAGSERTRDGPASTALPRRSPSRGRPSSTGR